MRPELVIEWRNQLPPPFNRPSPPRRRRTSFDEPLDLQVRCTQALATTTEERDGTIATASPSSRVRRNSAHGALEYSDRRVLWARLARADHQRTQAERVESALEKLRAIFPEKNTPSPAGPGAGPPPPATALVTRFSPLLKRSSSSSTRYSYRGPRVDYPTSKEIAALSAECFPSLHDAPVTITEFSRDSYRVWRYTLGELLESKHLLQPPLACEVRWIFVEYYKLGTFWGSDQRCFQWGTDPALFEASPIPLLQERLRELDDAAGRPTPEEEDIPGYKRIGKYYRQNPGCPEYLGLRTNSTAWIQDEKIQLLLKYLEVNPRVLKELQARDDNDLHLGLAYIKARETLIAGACGAKDGYGEIWQTLQEEGDHLLGSWDDHVERLEFWRDHTLLSCGSPRLYSSVADRLAIKDDPLRKNPDAASLYYTLARVSIENDEMMMDAPERSLNKLFIQMKGNRNTKRNHVESLFALQQVIFDQVEYIEENKRELPIWGIPPFPSHQVRFHHDHSPPPRIVRLINEEMKLVADDFRTVLRHWRLLQSKVGRHLDVLIQLRVLDQQDLAVAQSKIATSQQEIAVNEAKTLRFQSRSVFIFTAITIVFLPLSFFTSYFSMDVASTLSSPYESEMFWKICGPISGTIIVGVFAVARYVSRPVKDDPDEEEMVGGDLKIEPRQRGWLGLSSHLKNRLKMKLS